MAAPTVTERQTPTGAAKLEDGYQSLFAFENDPDIALWEVSLTPPGFDGGDPVDTTTMHNVEFHTKAPRHLIDMTEMSFTAAYAPESLTAIRQQINRKQAITQHHPDGAAWAFWGFLKSFVPGENSEGSMPTGQGTIVPTNYDPVNKVEAGPVLVAAPGT